VVVDVEMSYLHNPTIGEIQRYTHSTNSEKRKEGE
jgi:hypothetical protein